jgi:hypothetical protein
MAKTLYEDNCFKVLKSKDYVVVRKDFPYDFHSHFARYSGAREVIKLFNKKLIPVNPYFVTALRRISTEEEWEGFKEQKHKDTYINSSKGVRRKKNGRKGRS